MSAKYASVTFLVTALENNGFGAGDIDNEQRFGILIPIETIKSIDFNRVRNELLTKATKAHDETNQTRIDGR